MGIRLALIVLVALVGWSVPRQARALQTAVIDASCDADGNACLPAVACTSPAECVRGAVYDTLNNANAAYRTALLTLSTDALSPYWIGDAYAQAVQQVQELQSQGVYAAARLLSISLISESYQQSSAALRTCEDWLMDNYDAGSGALLSEADELVDNRYQLLQANGGWQVSEDGTAVLDAGCPLTSGNVTVTVQYTAGGQQPAPAAGVSVLAVPAGDATAPPAAGGTTDATGVVALALSPGDYWIYIPQPVPGTALTARVQSPAVLPDGTPVAQWAAVTVGDAPQSVTLSIPEPAP